MARDNHVRFDLSPFLIHFFRSVDLSKSDGSLCVDDWGPGAIVEDDHLTAFFLLRNAIRLGRLWATWSVRNGKRTIYGPDPAVCFTDMPLAAFIEAGIAREKKGEAMSPLALVIPKQNLHAVGALPAIYGLDGLPPLPSGKGGGPRIMPVSTLPLAEQFRYVTLAPSGGIDWTHEREWRWPCRNAVLPTPDDAPPNGEELPGLNLDFPGMGVVVATEMQAQKVIHDILVLKDQGYPGDYAFVLVAAKIRSLAKLRDPVDVRRALLDAAISLDQYLTMDRSIKRSLVADFDSAVSKVGKLRIKSHGREDGGCWLWLTDATHEMTRALVLDKRVLFTRTGRYLVELPFDDSLVLSEREALTRRLARRLRSKYGLKATYHSVLGKFDPEDLPHYSAPPYDDLQIFNYGFDGGDA